jgi:hypothetical protein
MDPKRQGHQNILCRQMLQDFEPPAWVREIIVVADAGSAAHVTRKLIHARHWTSVFAMPRTRKFTNGKYGRAMGQHLPKSRYRRRATSKPEGRHPDDGVFLRHAELHQRGDVTLVLAKKRRNCVPKRVKLLVTNLLEASEGTILSHYA